MDAAKFGDVIQKAVDLAPYSAMQLYPPASLSAALFSGGLPSVTSAAAFPGAMAPSMAYPAASYTTSLAGATQDWHQRNAHLAAMYGATIPTMVKSETSTTPNGFSSSPSTSVAN